MRNSLLVICEICDSKFKPNGSGQTECEGCKDRERAFRASQDERATLWGDKHKCRICADPLPLTRALYCEDCMVLESEDAVWDSVDSIDTEEQVAVKKRTEKPTVFVAEKTCNNCKLTLPRSQFYLCKGVRDGLDGKCKACRKHHWKEWDGKARGRLKELKAEQVAQQQGTLK